MVDRHQMRAALLAMGFWATARIGQVLRVLATSLYDDPAAELHEDASARLGEHLALPGCSILCRSSPGVGASGYQDPARARGGRRGQSQRATGFSGHCAADQLPNRCPRARGEDWWPRSAEHPGMNAHHGGVAAVDGHHPHPLSSSSSGGEEAPRRTGGAAGAPGVEAKPEHLGQDRASARRAAPSRSRRTSDDP